MRVKIGELFELNVWAINYVMKPICIILSETFKDTLKVDRLSDRIMVLFFDSTGQGLPPRVREIPVTWLQRKIS